MTTITIDDDLLSFLQELRNDPEALLVKRPATDFVFQPFKVNNVNGRWADKTGSRELQVQLVGPIGPTSTIGTYGSLNDAPASVFYDGSERIKGAHFKFTLEFHTSNYPNEVADRAPQPPVPKSLKHRENYEAMGPKPYAIHSFICAIDNRLQIIMSTDRMLIEDRPSKQSAINLFTGKNAAGGAKMPLNEWDDPHERWSQLKHILRWCINTDINAMDIDGEYVYPKDYKTVFMPGTWVVADCKLMFWDMTAIKTDRKPSRTYQILVNKIQAISEPMKSTVENTVSLPPTPTTPQKRKAVEEKKKKAIEEDSIVNEPFDRAGLTDIEMQRQPSSM
ncbi:hypothetical protein JB92DRAFT_3124668 [Gautieria morchelliformis]|nr:hypothetical protein JB92DRAFT_3124668 [Gautieria morchelliformis]